MESELMDQEAALGVEAGTPYGGDGQFYSAQIQRGFSIAGAQNTCGPGGPGPRRAHHGRHHGGGGRGRGAAVNGHTDVATTADVEAGGGDTGSGDSGGGTPSSLPGLLEDLYNFFSDLFGGGGGQSLPPNYFVYQARLQRARRHPQYPDIDGAATDIVLKQSPAAPKFCADPHPCNKPPLQKPQYTRPQQTESSGNLDYFNSCNVFSLTASGGLCALLGGACVASIPGEPEDAPVNVPACVIGGTSCIGFLNDLGCCIKPHAGCDNPERDFTKLK